jgi:hypothetical protein
MAYPPIPDPSRNEHVIYFSADGTSWRRLPDSIESLAQLQVTATLTSFGYYAVASKPRAGGPLSTTPGSRTNLIPTLVIVALVLLVAFFVLRFELRERRARRIRRAAGGSPPSRRRRRPPTGRDDW